jgi:putative MATE family efflux protein
MQTNELQTPRFTKKEIMRLILPLIVEQLLAVTIGMVDSVMVASCGEAAVSSVSLVDSINILLIQIFAALATGGAIVSSQYLGRQDTDSAKKSAKQLLVVVAFFALCIGIICLFLNRNLLGWLFGNTEKSVMDNCVVYFFWSAISYPFIGVYNAAAALFRSMNNSRISMVTSVIMNVTNLIGNALLIYGFNMGVAGAAISTCFSRILGSVIVVSLLRRRSNVVYIDTFRGFRLDFRIIKNILFIGIPSGLENGVFQIGKILVQGLVASLGTAAIAANSVANSVAAISNSPASAIGLGMLTIVGQCVGAQDYVQAKKYIFKMTALAYASLFIMAGILVLSINPIVEIYDLSEGTAAIARQLLLSYCCVAAILWPASFVMPNGLRAANDVKYTMTVSILSMWIFRVGFSYLLVWGFSMGVLGIWIAMFVDWIVRIIAFSVRLHGKRWMSKQLI